MDPIHTWRCWERIETLFCRGCGWQVARLSSCTCTCAFAPQAASVMSHGASYSWSSPNTKGSIRNLSVELLSCHLNNKWFPQIYHQINDLGLISHCSNLSMGFGTFLEFSPSWTPWTVLLVMWSNSIRRFPAQERDLYGLAIHSHAISSHGLHKGLRKWQATATQTQPVGTGGAHIWDVSSNISSHFLHISLYFTIVEHIFFAVNPFSVLVCA